MVWFAVMGLVGCSGPADPGPELVLDGPVTVHVDRMGPVEGPVVKLSDGSTPEGVAITVAPETVAVVEGGVVEAVGPGEAEVTVHLGEQSASWALIVEPRLTLQVKQPPGSIAVGKRVPLHVEALASGRNTDPGELTWSSSDPEIAEVDGAGVVVGKAPGVTFITVRSGKSEALVELEVQE